MFCRATGSRPATWTYSGRLEGGDLAVRSKHTTSASMAAAPSPAAVRIGLGSGHAAWPSLEKYSKTRKKLCLATKTLHGLRTGIEKWKRMDTYYCHILCLYL